MEWGGEHICYEVKPKTTGTVASKAKVCLKRLNSKVVMSFYIVL